MFMSVKRIALIAVAVIVAVCSFNGYADEYSGEKSLGFRFGYNTHNREPITGLQFTYRFNRLLRLSPDADYVFRRDGQDAMMANLNVDFMFPFAKGRCSVYPLAGLNYSSWNLHTDIRGEISDDVSSRESHLGLNLGGGFDVNISSSMRFSVSAAYTFIQTFHGANIMAGIHYRF
jgi:opacity protein-like surface antigen